MFFHHMSQLYGFFLERLMKEDILCRVVLICAGADGQTYRLLFTRRFRPRRDQQLDLKGNVNRTGKCLFDTPVERYARTLVFR